MNGISSLDDVGRRSRREKGLQLGSLISFVWFCIDAVSSSQGQ